MSPRRRRTRARGSAPPGPGVLEASLWAAADQLRANSKLNAAEYLEPVLGLIFLRRAHARFAAVTGTGTGTGTGAGGAARRADFEGRAAIFLPEAARWPSLAALPEAELGPGLDAAMAAIEAEAPSLLAGVLPRSYAELEPRTLAALLRIFDDEQLEAAGGDVFGRIYEYFLDKFAASLAGEAGQFFTPPSLVRLIVKIIEPDHGVVFDPAVGSAGMLVQSAHFIERRESRPAEAPRFFGRDKSETTVRLARMNAAVHGLDADIRVANSYYEPTAELLGRCDFVMANPPFNVDGVDPERIADDPRLWTETRIPGLSRGARTKAPGVRNANYLWIQYFRAYLGPRGRAGFVMPASATDAGHDEQAIRRELIETGEVEAIIRVAEKFFYTRALPCTLWFLDRARPAERRDRVLMIDARELYRDLSRRQREFSEEQLAALTALVWLWRGQRDRYLADLRRRFLALAGLAEQLDVLGPWRRRALAAGEALGEAATQAKLHAGLVDALPDLRARATEPGEQPELAALITEAEALDWLCARFPDARFTAVPGLCAAPTRAEIAAQDHSLTPGRYVGVAPTPPEDDAIFTARMRAIQTELAQLDARAAELSATINAALEELLE